MDHLTLFDRHGPRAPPDHGRNASTLGAMAWTSAAAMPVARTISSRERNNRLDLESLRGAGSPADGLSGHGDDTGHTYRLNADLGIFGQSSVTLGLTPTPEAIDQVISACRCSGPTSSNETAAASDGARRMELFDLASNRSRGSESDLRKFGAHAKKALLLTCRRRKGEVSPCRPPPPCSTDWVVPVPSASDRPPPVAPPG